MQYLDVGALDLVLYQRLVINAAASISLQRSYIDPEQGVVAMRSTIAVLVVEDEALIRMDIVDQLSADGFEVFEAATADDAISLLESHPEIQILFTDIDMPGSMDGLKLSAAVRDRWPPVKIVVTSGHRMIEVTDLPDGSVFFSKPYQHDLVVSSMRELLSTS